MIIDNKERFRMNFANISSGSDGNCTLFQTSSVNILIDAGISKKRINEGLKKFDCNVSEIDAILISHEHSDHICALSVIENKDHIPIYATKETIEEIKRKKDFKDETEFVEITPDKAFKIGDVMINPFSVSHDAANPIAFRLECKNKAFGVCTDLGIYDDYIIGNLKGLTSLLIESNHDIRMLETGPYPYYLKRRIMSNKGHLSNESSGRLISEIMHDDMEKIVLGHLSKQNNYVNLALEAVKCEIDMSKNKYNGNDFPIIAASHDTHTLIYWD